MLGHPFLRGFLLLLCCFGVAIVVLKDIRYFQHFALPSSTLSINTGRNKSSSASSTAKKFRNEVTRKCLMESRKVNGKEFSEVWPNHTSPQEVWRLPNEINESTVAFWHHPSNFSQLCAAEGDLGPSLYARPRYHSQDRPTGLRILMTGDSIMRYQFITLIHYLHTGHWIHDSMQPSLLRETSLAGDGGYPAFYRALERYFGQDSLICDGYRSTEYAKWSGTIYENSYYLDQECLDNSITFSAKYSYGLRGYEMPSDINNWFHSKDKNKSRITLPEGPHEVVNFTWSFRDYNEFLRNFVAKLEPRPKVFVFNEGLWPGASDNLSNETLLREIQNTIHELGMVSIYKTTTKYSHDRTPVVMEYEELCCQIFDYCLRMDWTACAPPSAYWDGCHFLAYANLRCEEQFFDILEQIGMMPW